MNNNDDYEFNHYPFIAYLVPALPLHKPLPTAKKIYRKFYSKMFNKEKKKLKIYPSLSYDPGDIPDRLCINVSGRRFDVPSRVFNVFPHTLLGNPIKRERFYDSKRDEYYFARPQDCFAAILYFYQTGVLRRPETVPLDTFLTDLWFFEMGKAKSRCDL